MTLQAQQYPGIYFEREKPQSRPTLPSMDIAAFVGFARSGPLHTPVPVKDIEEFRDIFGTDIQLAWDGEGGHPHGGYLGVSVEKFFRNGGSRCWIVRVADETVAQTAHYEIPGLIRTNGRSVEPAKALARSSGIWAESVSMRSQLQALSIPLTETESAEPSLSITSTGWITYLLAFETQVQIGDLISVDVEEAEGTYYLFVASVDSSARGLVVAGTRGFFHRSSEPSASPMIDASLALDTDASLSEIEIYGLENFSELGLSYSYPSNDSPVVLPRVRLLRFSLIAQDNRGLRTSLSDLTFTRAHPRFWAYLQDDQQLYRHNNGSRLQQHSKATQRLIAQSQTPRFPFASKDSLAEWFYLPVTMNASAHTSAKAIFQQREEGRAAIDGLINFGSVHFIDARLAHLRSDALAQEAKRLAFLRESATRLRGIHSLLAIDEPSLVAVPDAVHRRWHSIASPSGPGLSAPTLAPVEKIEGQEDCYRVNWSPVDGARSYHLQWDTTPDFTAPLTRTIGVAASSSTEELLLERLPPSDTVVKLKHSCPRTLFFRIRSEMSREISVWSNSESIHIPDLHFLQCGHIQPQTLRLILADANSVATSSPEIGEENHLNLSWHLLADSRASVYAVIDNYEIQSASDGGFLVLDSEIRVSADHLEDPEQPYALVERVLSSPRYYRVRAISGNTKGPWSNTVLVNPSYLTAASLEHKDDYSDADLLAIHRVLLRSCGARGDLFAVLGVPRHYQAEDVTAHYSALMPATSINAAATTTTDALTAFVTPLSYGETHLSSYAALYFPWATTRSNYTPASGDKIQTIPADGIVLGSIAAKTLSQGAWISPANTPLQDVLAVNIEISIAQWHRLNEARINVIRREPGGYRALSANTLSTHAEYREITARRLVNMIKRLVLDQGDRLVFEHNDQRLHDRVKQEFESLFSDIYARGAFAGAQASQAFRVITNESVNTPQSLAMGRFFVELHIAPAQPLKYLIIRLLQEGGMQAQVQEVTK